MLWSCKIIAISGTWPTDREQLDDIIACMWQHKFSLIALSMILYTHIQRARAKYTCTLAWRIVQELEWGVVCVWGGRPNLQCGWSRAGWWRAPVHDPSWTSGPSSAGGCRHPRSGTGAPRLYTVKQQGGNENRVRIQQLYISMTYGVKSNSYYTYLYTLVSCLYSKTHTSR